MTNEAKSSAAQFLADHEQLENELATAKLTMDDQRKELQKLDATIAMHKDAITQLTIDKNTYLRYCFELSAQLQFIVAGSARALLIAAQVKNALTADAAQIPPVPGADIVELEEIIHRIGENNAAANDGNGLTNGVLVDKDGKPVEPSAATLSMLKPGVAA